MVDYDYGKCLTCEHWHGLVRIDRREYISDAYNFDAIRHIKEKCLYSGKHYNPHDGNIVSSDFGCQYWEESPVVANAKHYHEERERKERADREKHERIEQNIKNYTEELHNNPNSATVYYNRSIAYNEIGNKNAAFEDLEKALDIEPSNDNYRGALEKALKEKAPHKPFELKLGAGKIIKYIVLGFAAYLLGGIICGIIGLPDSIAFILSIAMGIAIIVIFIRRQLKHNTDYKINYATYEKDLAAYNEAIDNYNKKYAGNLEKQSL
jgi:hypothetical protein